MKGHHGDESRDNDVLGRDRRLHHLPWLADRPPTEPVPLLASVAQRHRNRYPVWDVITKATEPIDAALSEAKDGQAARVGAIGLATILIVGFGLHNATEGFGIAAPLSGSPVPSWAFLGLAGLIGGGPTFLGTLLGYSVKAEPVFVLCLALAAGSILYVVAELFHVGRRFALRERAMAGVVLGFFLGYWTDLLLTWAGA